jgi:hypothetical protein
MKPIVIISIGIGAFVCGTLGGTVQSLFIAPNAPAPTAVLPTTATTEFVATATDDGTGLELAILRNELDLLRDQVASLRSERTNAAETTATPVAAIQTNAPTRDVILGVLQDEDERRTEERRLEREKREQDSLDRRIKRIAEKLSLSSTDQTALTQIYKEERAKQTLMWTQMRDGGMDRELMREAMTEVRDWRTEQLTLSFGEDLAGQIADEGGGRGWDWGGGRGNNNDSGGRGGRGGRGN